MTTLECQWWEGWFYNTGQTNYGTGLDRPRLIMIRKMFVIHHWLLEWSNVRIEDDAKRDMAYGDLFDYTLISSLERYKVCGRDLKIFSSFFLLGWTMSQLGLLFGDLLQALA